MYFEGRQPTIWLAQQFPSAFLDARPSPRKAAAYFRLVRPRAFQASRTHTALKLATSSKATKKVASSMLSCP